MSTTERAKEILFSSDTLMTRLTGAYFKQGGMGMPDRKVIVTRNERTFVALLDETDKILAVYRLRLREADDYDYLDRLRKMKLWPRWIDRIVAGETDLVVPPDRRVPPQEGPPKNTNKESV
jgi:hypothetical protein